MAADGHIPREIAYSWLPDIDDPKEVNEMMQEQTAKSIKNQQQAMLAGNPDYVEGSGKQDQQEQGKQDQEDQEGQKGKEVADDKLDKQNQRRPDQNKS